MTDETDSKSVMLFGRDVSKVPCFRNSCLYGISSGVVGGLAIFLFTSRPKLSCDAGFGTFVAVTLIYWTYCRNNWVQQKFNAGQLQSIIRQRNTLQDSEKEKEIREKEPTLHDA